MLGQLAVSSDEPIVGFSFIVELCELVQLQTIEIGNLELFSSLPQSFEVHISERFVTIHITVCIQLLTLTT